MTLACIQLIAVNHVSAGLCSMLVRQNEKQSIPHGYTPARSSPPLYSGRLVALLDTLQRPPLPLLIYVPLFSSCSSSVPFPHCVVKATPLNPARQFTKMHALSSLKPHPLPSFPHPILQSEHGRPGCSRRPVENCLPSHHCRWPPLLLSTHCDDAWLCSRHWLLLQELRVPLLEIQGLLRRLVGHRPVRCVRSSVRIGSVCVIVLGSAMH